MLRRARPWTLACLVVAFSLLAAACSDDDDDSADDADTEEASGGGGGGGGGLLAEVQERGTLRCGVNEGVPGFGLVDEAGDYTGFDIEFCKVVAAAVLGDPEAVEYTALDAETALHRPPGRRHRRPDPQHHLHGQPRRRRGRPLPDHDVLRRPGDDGAGRLGLYVDRRHGRHDDLRAVGNDDRAQPRHGRGRRGHHVHPADLHRARPDPGGVLRGPVPGLDVGQVAAGGRALGLPGRPGRP